MKNEIIAVLVVALLVAVLVAASLGASYFSGAVGRQTVTTTSTVTSTLPGIVTVENKTSTITTTLTSTNFTTVLAPSPGGLGNWAQTKSYPLYVSETSCVTSSGFAYCVGGYNGTTPQNGMGFLNRTYFASLSSNGTSDWMRTTDYPIGIEDETCVTALGYIYCVGGSSTPTSNTADVYYAPLSSSGIGLWTKTVPYPYPAPDPRCVTYGSTIDCIGGIFNGTLHTAAFYATVSPTGVGNWTQTTAPPTLTAGCSAIYGYAYCFGGGGCPPPGPCPSPSYFAELSSNGLGNWTTTTELPTAVYAEFTTGVAFQYYFSDPVYFGALSHDGIGAWGTTTPYPDGYPASCFASGFYVYCIGGSNVQTDSSSRSSYFAQVIT